MIKVIGFLFVTVFAFFANECGGSPPSNQPSKSGAESVKEITNVPKNSKGLTVEQSNIDGRVKITNDPTKVLWIHLIALDGKIIRRMPVRNKVTSSGKRLEPKIYMPSQYEQSAPLSYNGMMTNEYLQPDGTFGDSDPYIFWFDPQGRYHQWGTAGGLGYLLTDYPIDLANPVDEITGLYNVHKLAQEWQQEEEKKLRGGK